MTETDRRRESINPGRFKTLYPTYGPVDIDDHQLAIFTVFETSIVSGRERSPPTTLHPFTGRRFLVSVLGCDTNPEVLSIVAEEGMVAMGENVSIEVVDISDAIFADRK